MHFTKNKWGLLGINLLASILFSFAFSSGEAVLTYINVLFYMIAFYLTAMLAMVVMRGRFLDGPVYGMRRFLSRIGKNKDYMDEWETKSLPSEKVNTNWIRLFFWQGLFLGIVMVVFLMIYYA